MNIRLYKTHEFLDKHHYNTILVHFADSNAQILMCNCGACIYKTDHMFTESLLEAWGRYSQKDWDEEGFADPRAEKVIHAYMTMRKKVK